MLLLANHESTNMIAAYNTLVCGEVEYCECLEVHGMLEVVILLSTRDYATMCTE